MGAFRRVLGVGIRRATSFRRWLGGEHLICMSENFKCFERVNFWHAFFYLKSAMTINGIAWLRIGCGWRDFGGIFRHFAPSKINGLQRNPPIRPVGPGR